LLQHKLRHAGNTVLLFDGYDEISPDYSDNVLSIVTELRVVNVRKVWIIPHPVMRKNLANEISSRLEAYRLIVERRFAYPNDPERYADGSVSSW
jgi:hypothetical protein